MGRTIIEGAKVFEINVDFIRCTELVWFEKGFRVSSLPIVLVEIGNYYYIADGNHRYVRAVKRGKETMQAVIFTPKDRDNLTCRGKGDFDFVASWLELYTGGEHTFASLKKALRDSYLDTVEAEYSGFV